MKPILFEKDATSFESLGLARLPDAISCTVTEERNGAYELAMIYPVSGRYFDEIQEDRILAVIPYDGGTKQAFRIYRISTPISGQVEVNARHISYQMNFIPCDAVSGTGTASAMFTALKNAALQDCPFTFETDIPGSLNYALAEPILEMRSAIGGTEGSMLDTYGGELEWDNWTVKLHASRGTDKGVRITYGKNLRDLTKTVDIGDTITGVAAYYAGMDDSGNEVTVYSSPRVITNDNAGDYAHGRTMVLDLSSEFETVPTTAQVTTAAQSYLAATSLAQVSEAITVDFVPLWQSPEYIQIAPLERVGLCDTVYVGYPQLGVSVKKKVTKTVYNVLLDRYDEIELGGESTLADTIAGLQSAMEGGSTNAGSMFTIATAGEAAAASIAAGSFRSSSFSVAKSGYKPIALAGFTTNHQNVCIVKMIIEGDSVSFNIRNVSTSQANAKAEAKILYMKN